MGFVILLVYSLSLYLKLRKSDPGKIQPNEFELDEMLRELAEDESPQSYCQTCYVRKNLRTKHYLRFGCIVRFDHYCVWIGNCVGVGNHLAFLFALFMFCVTMITFVTVSILTINHNISKSSNFKSKTFLATFNELFMLFTPLIWIVIYLILQTLTILALLYDQFRLIAHNLTKNEEINGHRYNHVENRAGMQYSTLDQGGYYKNVKYFVNECKNWRMKPSRSEEEELVQQPLNRSV
eukprot:c2054_g1_i1.p1 GENE.c2054_g1_i1~~c2054_g1_i1.p1  ORF type:complete len:237 (-),score=71.35 c2054_g1_i1:44-754(-)